MKKKYFVYITLNLINGKQYVGDHSTSNIKKDKYLGSGKIIKSAIKKYGYKNFKCKILEFFDTKEEAFNAQEKYIQQFNTLVPNGYNISPKGGYGVPGSFLNEETKQKISKSNIGKHSIIFSEEHKKKISNALIGNQWNKGKKLSKETKQKLSDKLLGIKRSEETKNKQKKAWETRELPSLETKKRMSISAKKQKECEYCHKICNIGNYNRWHGNNCKQKV